MFTAGDWTSFLSDELDCSVRVRFGRARQRVLEARPVAATESGARPGLEVRLSWFFADAPPDVREAVARWLRVGRRARKSSELLDRWIATTLAELPPAPRREPRVEPRGEVHDLRALARELDVRGHVELETQPRLTWGRRRRSRARHSLQLGSYQPGEHLVRVHPVLDQDWVPEWFVRYVLFHELLHAALPADRTDGPRTVHHPPEFRRRERSYPDYRRALLWQERHLPLLLRSTHGPVRPERPAAVKPGGQGVLFAV